MVLPVSYDFINAYNSQLSPSTVHCSNTELSFFFRRYLWQKAFSVYKWTAPEWWNMDYFRYVLYNCGYIAVVNVRPFGVIPQAVTLRGYNVFYAPTHAILVNPRISGIREPEIGKECEIIKLQPDYRGIADMIFYYADMMALAAEAAAMNTQNSKLSYVVGAKSKTMAEAIKKIYDQVQEGNGLAVYDPKQRDDMDGPLFETFTQNLKENFIAEDLISYLRRLDNEFCTRIGLPNTNTEKKARMNVDEVNANNVETEAWAANVLELLQDGCKKVNDMFDVGISVDWRFDHAGSNTLDSGLV